MEDDDLLTAEEAAEALDVSTRTLAGWRSSGEHDLPYLKIGREVRYRQSDIDELLDLWSEEEQDAGDDEDTDED